TRLDRAESLYGDLTLRVWIRQAGGDVRNYAIWSGVADGLLLPSRHVGRYAANVLIIPFLQLLMHAAVIAIAVSYVSLTLAIIPAAIAGIALQGIAGTVKGLGGLQLADIRVPTPRFAAIVFAAVAIGLCRDL